MSAPAFKFSKPEPRAREKRRRLRELRRETAELREAVMARAKGVCECGCGGRGPLEMDHWVSGSGRRRQLQSEATCWGLLPGCHLARTNNQPSAAEWNRRFAEHARRNGYPAIAHTERSGT